MVIEYRVVILNQGKFSFSIEKEMYALLFLDESQWSGNMTSFVSRMILIDSEGTAIDGGQLSSADN